MNDHDRQNIEFIRNLACNPHELVAWLKSVKDSGDESEIEYALDMLFVVRNQLELELLAIFDADAAEDVTEAAEYLQRFRLQ